MFTQRPLHGVGPSLPVRPTTDRSTPKLCEKGRAYITDPSTGQPVCLCQLENHSAHGLQAHPALRGLHALPAARPAGFGDLHSYRIQLSAMAPLAEQSNCLLSPHVAFHPYGNMYAGMDVNGGPIRKAATRETTGPLKIWLSEHKKNPYPTKAEKIMLAIITRMTLTQVSTWFANARRRLKKDNRLSPGTGEEDSVGMDSDREGDTDGAVIGGSVDVGQEAKAVLRTDVPLSSEGEAEPDSFSDISDEENEVFKYESPEGSNKRTLATRLQITAPPTSPTLCQPEACPTSPTVSQSGACPTSTTLSQSGACPTSPTVSQSGACPTSTNMSQSGACPTLPTVSQSGACPTLPTRVTAAAHGVPESTSSQTPKLKPKIWSISHILDS